MNSLTDEQKLQRILDWCTRVVGPCEIVSNDKRFHGRTSVFRLRMSAGHCYAKVHRQKSSWEREVYAHTHWAPAFGAFAPALLSVRADEPMAILVGELPGGVLESKRLSVAQEERAWHDAGRALAGLHSYAAGEFFGTESSIRDAHEYILAQLKQQTDRAQKAGYLNDQESAVLCAATSLAAVFAGQRPVPCHRDYNPANWLVTEDGLFCGVIDFEMACWDVRVADFCRYPNWEWIDKPNLLDAFFEGYGRSLTSQEQQQCLVMRAKYALDAIVWGAEHSYHGFVEEGRKALKHLSAGLTLTP